MKQMKNEMKNEWSKKTWRVLEKIKSSGFTKFVEPIYIHLTFPLTASHLSWVGMCVHAQLKWVCVSASLLATLFLLILF